MAWWYVRLLFHGDRLIDAGVHDVVPANIDFAPDPNVIRDGEQLTSVWVSGYAYAGQVRGYYAAGVAHMLVDPLSGRGYMSEEARRHAEGVESLSSGQRAAVRRWLMEHDSAAWDASLETFRRSLGAPFEVRSPPVWANLDSTPAGYALGAAASDSQEEDTPDGQ